MFAPDPDPSGSAGASGCILGLLGAGKLSFFQLSGGLTCFASNYFWLIGSMFYSMVYLRSCWQDLHTLVSHTSGAAMKGVSLCAFPGAILRVNSLNMDLSRPTVFQGTCLTLFGFFRVWILMDMMF